MGIIFLYYSDSEEVMALNEAFLSRAQYNTKDRFLALHPAVLGSIHSIPKDLLSLCC